MILEAAMFLQLASQCGEGVPPAILAGINKTESAYNTLAINVNGKNSGGTVHGIKNLEQAKAKARELIRAGRNFDAGLMQINSANWKWLGLTVDTVFHPCTNINAAARLLNSFGKYNAGVARRGIQNGYAARTWQNMQGVSHETSPATPSPAPLPAPAPTPVAAPAEQASCPIPPVPPWAVFGQARRDMLCSRISLTNNVLNNSNQRAERK